MNHGRKISCSVCLDLIPLVRDQVASQDSTALVREHIQGCKNCRLELEGPIILEGHIDDEKIIKSMRRRLMMASLFLVVCGALVGISLTNTFGMLYNILIMPVVGGLGFLILKKKWYVMNLGILVMSCIWLFIQGLLEDSLLSFSSPLLLSGLYAGLSVLGVIIAALLRFALKNEVIS